MSTRSPSNGTPSAASSAPLALALRERAVGAHDALPRHVVGWSQACSTAPACRGAPGERSP